MSMKGQATGTIRVYSSCVTAPRYNYLYPQHHKTLASVGGGAFLWLVTRAAHWPAGPPAGPQKHNFTKIFAKTVTLVLVKRRQVSTLNRLYMMHSVCTHEVDLNRAHNKLSSRIFFVAFG
jgi:hypothetical protein